MISASKRAFVLSLACGMVIGCTESPLAPIKADARLFVQAGVAGTPITTMTLEVTGAGIGTNLVFNLDITDGVASGSITVPVGSDRLFTGRAFDGFGLETHRGVRSGPVHHAGNPPLSLVLLPVHGTRSVEVSIGSYAVTVTPTEATLAVSGTAQLQAVIHGPDQGVIDEPVSWASLQPAVAAVDASGLVTGHAPGDAQIVATYGGSGGSAMITVGEPVFGAIRAGKFFNLEHQVDGGDTESIAPDWPPDGRTLVVSRNLPGGFSDLVTIRSELPGPPLNLANWPANEFHPHW
jgi:hypothetical protein